MEFRNNNYCGGKWGWKKAETNASNPAVAAAHLQKSGLNVLRERPEYVSAIKFAKHVFLAWTQCKEPKYDAIFDQICRNSSSIANNLAEGHAKDAIWPERIARGEAFEAATCCEFLPPGVSELLRKEADKLIELLDANLLERWNGRS